MVCTASGSTVASPDPLLPRRSISHPSRRSRTGPHRARLSDTSRASTSLRVASMLRLVTIAGAYCCIISKTMGHGRSVSVMPYQFTTTRLSWFESSMPSPLFPLFIIAAIHEGIHALRREARGLHQNKFSSRSLLDFHEITRVSFLNLFASIIYMNHPLDKVISVGANSSFKTLLFEPSLGHYKLLHLTKISDIKTSVYLVLCRMLI